MIRALLAKAIDEGKVLLAALCALVFGFAWLQLWVSSKISLPAFSEFLARAVPQQWERLSPVPFSEVATPAGRIAVAFVHPVVLLATSIWAIARGSDCVSGEIGRGTMELILAQPVSRWAVYATQALATVLGAALLSLAVWCGTAVGLATTTLPEEVPAALFLAPAVGLFGRTLCVAGVSAMVSSWDSQRWRTVGVVVAWTVASIILEIVGRVSDALHWVGYFSFMTAYAPQSMVAHPDEAWSLLAYRDGTIAGLGLGGQQLVLFGLGILCYAIGAIIFNRREIPAPL